MKFKPFFASSSKIWEDITWIYAIEETGYTGWEISADGKYRLDEPVFRDAIIETLESTKLKATIHAPYSDLNIAALNPQIWEVSVRQICSCIAHASGIADMVTFHPGYLGPAGKLIPEKVWELQKNALQKIDRIAGEHGIHTCLENMPAIPDLLCQSPYELEGLTEGLEHVGMTIDIGHSHTTRWEKNFYPLIGSADHLHIHDNHTKSDEHLPIGSGTVSWKTVSEQVKALYQKEIIVIEGRSIPDAALSLQMFMRWFS